MDWARFKAALIRTWWAFAFPMIGALVVYWADPQVLEDAGITNALVISIISGVLYGLKKLFWPDSTF